VELRDHLGAIEVSAALLEESALTAGERGVVLAAIHQKIAACVHVLTECQKYLGREADTQVINCHPLDGLEVLREACQEVGMKAADRRVTFNVEQPQLMEHVLAAKQELKKVFVTILGLLIGDAAENTVLKITVAAVQQRVIFRFTNSGFGIPNDRLQNILTSAALPASEEFQLLREALAWVRNWSGTLEVTSGVGTGYCVVVQLRQFQLSSFLAMGAV
jgi:signal transduction histidine kinase